MKTVVALGNFDGVHLGHRVVLAKTQQLAELKGMTPVVFTFDVNPATVISPSRAVRQITDREEKARRIKSTGINNIVSVDFNDVRDMDPEEFVRYLILKLNARIIVTGYNFCFGKNRSGNTADLSDICKAYKIECVTAEEVREEGAPVSSTRIRRLLSAGNIELANKLLVEPYSVYSEVIRGRQLGRQLSAPTVNQITDENAALPAKGVYITQTYADGKCFPSVTNIGTRPTVDASSKIYCETHIFAKDMIPDMYGKKIKVTFLKFLREEHRFSDKNELMLQIERDIAAAKKFFNGIDSLK